MQRSLQRGGYDVSGAQSGEQALGILERAGGRIALLITDVVVTGMTGPELARRARAISPRLKVLFASGYADGMLAQPGVLEGRVHFLSKPFSPSKLAHAVRRVLDAAE